MQYVNRKYSDLHAENIKKEYRIVISMTIAGCNRSFSFEGLLACGIYSLKE